MISESSPRLSIRASAFAALALALALQAGPARAEDPLLGSIKVIQCVGCNPGSVNLIIHDPIDVRDFEVQIQESDYQKIVTPLAGKTVYDKNGCFYWMELPKGSKEAKEAKETEKKSAKKTGKKDAVAVSDSSKPGLVETSGEPQGTPSRCLPYTRVEPKPAPKTGGGKTEE